MPSLPEAWARLQQLLLLHPARVGCCGCAAVAVGWAGQRQRSRRRRVCTVHGTACNHSSSSRGVISSLGSRRRRPPASGPASLGSTLNGFPMRVSGGISIGRVCHQQAAQLGQALGGLAMPLEMWQRAGLLVALD
jgi:hypothetical protein